MTYSFGIFGSFGGKNGIKLVERILTEIREGRLEANVPFVFTSCAFDEPGNAPRLREIVGPEMDIIPFSARRFRPQLFCTDREHWRVLYHREIVNLISGYQFDAILLVGYMLFTSDEFSRRYHLFNLHPAPPGGPQGSWREVMWKLAEEQAEVAGAQVHLATPAWDAGLPISYFTVSLRSEGFASLWEECQRRLITEPFSQIKAAEYETNPLVNKIREVEVRGELPLLLATLRHLANRDFRLEGEGEKARLVAFGREVRGGYNINDEIGSGDHFPAVTVGSVKRLAISKPPTTSGAGEGSFLFTDRYSVFDWGAMPDLLPGKGASLCMMSAYNFETLKRAGITTHYRGVRSSGRTVPYNELAHASAEMAITVVNRPPLVWTGSGYDYPRYFHEAGRDFLVPLEVIYRRTVPRGSSLRTRYTPGALGLDHAIWPEEEVVLPHPMVEFFTKLEGYDRPLDREQAPRLSGVSEALFREMEEITLQVEEILSAQARKQGLEIADGKLEFAVCHGKIIVCDVVGTPDENRFQFSGHPVNKEVLRNYHRSNNPQWVEAVTQAKRAHAGRPGWQEGCTCSPLPLPAEFRDLCAAVYRAVANRYLGRKWFAARELEKLVGELEEWSSPLGS